MTEPEIKPQIDAIMARLAKKLDRDEVTLPDLLDGGKVLTGWYVAVSRNKAKEVEEPGNGTFTALKRRLSEDLSGTDTEQ